MSIQNLIATQAQRTAGPSPIELLAGMQGLQGQKIQNEGAQLRNTAMTQSLDQNKKQRALEFAANIGLQLKQEQDPAKKQQIYGSALELARMNGYEMTPIFPQQYDDRAQQMLDVAHMQVYAPQEFEARLKGAGISLNQKEFNNHVNQLQSAIGPDGKIDPAKLSVAQRASAIELGLIPRATGSAAITAATTEGLTNQVASSEATIKGATAGATENAKLDARMEKEPELKRQNALQTAIGKGQGEAQVMLPETIKAAEYSIELLDKALSHPGLNTATGASSRADPRNFIPGTDAYDFNVLMDQVQGRTFFQAYESLKGGGQITEVEGKKAEQSIARLNKAQSKEEFVTALKELQEIIRTGMERAKAKSGMGGGSSAKPAVDLSNISDDELLNF